MDKENEKLQTEKIENNFENKEIKSENTDEKAELGLGFNDIIIEPEEEEKPKKKRKKEKPKEKEGKPENLKLRGITLGILLVVMIIAGGGYFAYVVGDKGPKSIYNGSEHVKEVIKETVTFYLPDETGKKLIKTEKELEVSAKEEERVKLIFEEIRSKLNYTITYTNKDGEKNTTIMLDPGSEIMDVYVDEKDLYLNMNSVFKKSAKDRNQETLIIYSIVNTLTEDSRYEKVKFLINNKEAYRLNNYKLSSFFEKNNHI